MWKRVAALLMILLLIPTFALAGRQYIIPDSNTRYLSEDELWEWDYESLGYILNEIFARHGYCFISGGKYDNFFSSLPWYTPNANTNNSEACYSQLSSVEWSNERLVKDVRSAMRAQGTRNTNGKHYLDYISFDNFDVLTGFVYTAMKTGQKLKVYSAPSSSSYRGADGKALVSTNGSVYVAGWESGWLLLMYETNNGAVRVGYVSGSSLKGKVNARNLQFEYQTMTCISNAKLTDDPATTFTTIRTICKGEEVTYLTSFQNRHSWAYIETTVDGKTVRGFIPSDALPNSFDADEEAGS